MQTSIAPDINSIAVQPELSRIVRLDDITSTANTMMIDATVRECMALAMRFELSYVRSLSAEITYRRVRSGQMIRIDGRITASYGQTCGLTLASMPMNMEESFQSEYTLSAWEKYSEFDLDQPEILTDDFIDMGEVVAEYFSLGVDPYVRRQGAEMLPELAGYLSEAIQELLASHTPQPQADVAEFSEPMAAEPTGEVIEFLSAPPEPAPSAEVIDMTVAEVADEIETADMGPAEDLEPAHESLFMKYLRRLRAA